MFFSFSKSKPLPYGTLIGTVTIDGIELEVFSNHGYEDRPKEGEVWTDLNGEYLGYKYHCVGLIRRYLYFKTGKNYALLWSEGNAKDWYANAEKMGLARVPHARDLRVGDLVCFEGGEIGNGTIGHIGFVRSVDGDDIFITHQNIAQNESDLNHKLSLEKMDFDGYIFQGGLRV